MAGGNYDRSAKNSILNPAVSYAFALQVEAAFMLPCRSVRVFTKENEFDYYQEGGLNDYVHMLRKPISKPFTFQVERYVGVSASADFNMGFVDPLTLGTDLILPLVLYVNRSPSPDWADNISFDNCARAYIFTGATVISKEYGELNAEQSKLLTETTTIAYRELFTINQISPAWEKGKVWNYPKEGESYTGTGEQHDANRQKATTLTNLSSEDMKKIEKNKFRSQWEYPKLDKPYTGETGAGKSRDENKNNNGSNAKNLSKIEMTDPSKNANASWWHYPAANEPYTSTGPSRDLNKNNSRNMPKDAMISPVTNPGYSRWQYPVPGMPYDGGNMMQRPMNRNDGPHNAMNASKAAMEASASIYPPKRRALMADILSK